MTDLLLSKGRQQTTIKGMTSSGKSWLRRNTVGYNKDKGELVISNEFVEDFTEAVPPYLSYVVV